MIRLINCETFFAESPGCRNFLLELALLEKKLVSERPRAPASKLDVFRARGGPSRFNLFQIEGAHQARNHEKPRKIKENEGK